MDDNPELCLSDCGGIGVGSIRVCQVLGLSSICSIV